MRGDQDGAAVVADDEADGQGRGVVVGFGVRRRVGVAEVGGLEDLEAPEAGEAAGGSGKAGQVRPGRGVWRGCVGGDIAGEAAGPCVGAVGGGSGAVCAARRERCGLRRVRGEGGWW